MKLHLTQSLPKSHITPPRPSTSTAISNSSPTTKLSQVFPAISLLLLSIRSKTSTVGHQMYSSLLSPTCAETQKYTSRPSRSSRTVVNASKPIFFEPAFNDPTITKYQAFHQKKADLRMIRLLPIFSVLYVHRHAANDELNSQHDFW